ncbi:MAG: peptidylprolyl isomerase [Sphingomonas sp.]
MTDPAALEQPKSALHSRSERRALILCGIGAICGLAIAGAGLFTAQGTRIAGVPPEDVALVNQVPLLMTDYVSLFEATETKSFDKGTPEEKRKVLDQMIREELYVQRGVELGLQNDITEVRQSLVGAVEAQQAIDASATQPDEDALRDFYRRPTANYADEGTMTVTDLIAPNQAQAQAAVSALRGGKPLLEASKAYALRDSGVITDGEEFYFAAQIHLGQRLFDVARRLREGQVSDPVAAPNGIHILVMRKHRPPVPTPYERVRDRVLADYRADKVTRMQAGADKFLRKRADVQIAQGFE